MSHYFRKLNKSRRRIGMACVSTLAVVLVTVLLNLARSDDRNDPRQQSRGIRQVSEPAPEFVPEPDFELNLDTERTASVPRELKEVMAESTVSTNKEDVVQYAIDQSHANCFCEEEFPSAKKCGVCHPKHYREWSVSPHSYGQLSPVMNSLFGALNELVTGTVGDFCLRCHTPVGAAKNEPRNMSVMDRHPTSREGVTCVVCHRINQPWGKSSGRPALVPGGTEQVVYGTLGAEVLQQVLADPDKYGVLTTTPGTNERARLIHADAQSFFQLPTSGFCGVCHDVVTPSGFRLEDAFSEYKSSPAAREHSVTCQDCHMGVVEGAPQGYYHEPIAMVGNVSTPPRKRTSHYFAGPDHSVIHPGLFPHNPEAIREEDETADAIDTGLATMREWLQFDHKADWGRPKFEKNIPEGYVFPEPWTDAKRRAEARAILKDQFELLNEYTRRRAQVLTIGYQVGDIEGINVDRKGLQFKVKVSNGTTGHGVPTGFDGERPLWMQVIVRDREDRVLFRSGDLDPNGDYRDDHSFFVHNGDMPRDRQLFYLQSKFVTRNIRGNEREHILPVPFSLDPLSFNRPFTRPFSQLGRPLGARKHKQNLEVGGHRWAKYNVSMNQLSGKGPYKVSVRLVAGMVPVNLVHIISFVGFDYNMSAKEIANGIVAGHLSLHERHALVHCHE